MPKLFPISLEVEEVAVGRVLRALNTMTGVVRLHLNLTPEGSDKSVRQVGHEEAEFETPAPTFTGGPKWRKDGRINTKGVPVAKNAAYRTIAEVLRRTPAHYKILQAALQRMGVIHPQAIHGHLHRMHLLKLVRRIAPGTYRLTEKGEKLFSPQGVTEKQERKLLPGSNIKVIDNHTGVRHLILKTLYKSSPMSGGAITKVLIENGYSPKNLSTTGMKMRNEELFEVKDGKYSITAVGRIVLENPPNNERSDPQTSNQQEMTNG